MSFVIKPVISESPSRRKYSESDLKLEVMKSGEFSNFKNCICKKIYVENRNFCVKVYTNLTLQVTGVKNAFEVADLLTEANITPPYSEFLAHCMLQNWSAVISQKRVNLKSTMDRLNDNGHDAFFLRGSSLHITKKVIGFKNELTGINFCDGKFIVSGNKGFFAKDLCISIQLFATGKAIICGMCSETAFELLSNVKQHLIYI